MCFYKKKKRNQFKSLNKLLERKNPIFLLSVTELTITDKIFLKKELKKFGLDFMVLKNKIFIQQIQQNFPKLNNLISLVQGFCILLYPLDTEIGKIDYNHLKDFGLFLEKQPNIFFLGGLFENELINQKFLNNLKEIKNFDTIYQNIITLLKYPQRGIQSTLQSSSNKLHYTIVETTKVEK